MVYFPRIKPTAHYREYHETEVPWHEVVKIIVDVKNMRCPKCNGGLREVKVKIERAKRKVPSYQCQDCDYFEFESRSAAKALVELRDTPLKIRQKIVKLSQDRLGIYFNAHVVRSLNLHKGDQIHVSVPDDKHILVELE